MFLIKLVEFDVIFVELVLMLVVLIASITFDVVIAVDLLIIVVAVVSIKADVPDVLVILVCALTEQLPNPATKKAHNKQIIFIYFGWRFGSESHASLAEAPIFPSIGQGVPAIIIAS